MSKVVCQSPSTASPVLKMYHTHSSEKTQDFVSSGSNNGSGDHLEINIKDNSAYMNDDLLKKSSLSFKCNKVSDPVTVSNNCKGDVNDNDCKRPLTPPPLLQHVDMPTLEKCGGNECHAGNTEESPPKLHSETEQVSDTEGT